ncbi:HTH-type transcriptional regulator CynR [Clostridium homopropionicum DSM 5847]|uniref:HTH-type transcriptional regulator CynR n=1 Tax=Clostridium homopropionicum DSM 5847 TaxID=1121318 RepID=A0A0L6Z6X0_9CLOT|nr:LysR family transcriptional regulator [Clostridium homopropionicum]KOA18704.1 HTH-type transcriptional regulator CynR [Clostridium homopropionicum DSM 5847]SFG53271.1 DNA-binding transcriptional regulator, LysR family [Clostridium homopropionicum]
MDNNLELYKIFYTVASCGNISLASEKLYISQPAVSKSIKKLEAALGITLFSRNSRGVKLTEEGMVFYQYIERALNEINVGEKVIDKLKNKEAGIIKLGVSTTLCKHFLIPKLKRFIKEYPHIEVKIINKTPYETLKILENGELDMVIISEPPEKDFYNFIELYEIQDIFVAEKNYLESLNIKNYNDIFPFATLMLMESGNISRGYIDKYFKNNNIVIKPEIEVSNMDLLIEFAKIGLGVTAVIKNFIKNELKEGKLVEIPITPPIPKRNIGVVYHKNIPLSVAAETFLKYLV